MNHEHEIFVSADRTCCTCGFNREVSTYSKARAEAEKHALAFRSSSIIKPLVNN